MGVTGGFEQKTDFGLDWLSVTVWTDVFTLQALIKDVDEALLLGLEPARTAGRGYHDRLLTPDGTSIFHNPVNEDEHCSLQLSGTGCNYWQPERIIEFFGLLESKGMSWRVSRLDLAFDHQQFTTSQFADVVRHSWDLISTRVHQRSVKIWEQPYGDGATVYFGSRQSEAFLRVYNKQILGHDRFGDEFFTRCEIELKKNRADIAFRRLLGLNNLREWITASAEYLNGMLSVAADWWSNWLQNIGKSWFQTRRPSQSIERTAAWIEKQVAGALAMVAFAKSPEQSGGATQWLTDLSIRGWLKLHEGKRQMSHAHAEMVKAQRQTEHELAQSRYRQRLAAVQF